MTLAGSKTVLVTGASGYLGGIVCRFFSGRGWRVLRAGRRPDDSVQLDFADPLSVASTSIGEPVDAVVHCAAANEVVCVRSPAEAAQTNVAGTVALLECAVANRIPQFVYLSTFHVFGAPSGVLNENSEPSPGSVYGITHAQAEQWVCWYEKRHAIAGCIVRPSNIFGMPESLTQCARWSLVPLGFVRDAVHSGRIELKTSGLQERNWVSADTVCETALGMIEGRWSTRVAHAAGPHTTSVLEFARRVARVVGPIIGREVQVTAAAGTASVSPVRFCTSLADPVVESESAMDDYLSCMARALAGMEPGSRTVA